MMPTSRIIYTDEVGDKWEEFNVFHHKFLTWLEVNGYDVEEVKQIPDEKLQEIVTQSPYYKATSNDVDWMSKVRMQGEIQKWVDHSISVTINLPNHASEELVGQLYVTAWESGCKGVTVYREGSRSGVLINNKDKDKESPIENDGLRFKRPSILDAEIIRFNNNEEKWIAFIGIKDNKPYEIFTGIVDDEMFPIPKSITRGKIIKNQDEQGKSRYDFQYTDKYGYNNTLGGLSHMFNKEFWNYAKLFSSVLRHGMPIPDVVNLIASLSLTVIPSIPGKTGWKGHCGNIFPTIPGLKKVSCTECGSDNLVYQEGCLVCTSCGSSKCG